jgi:hypothetical protein
MKMNEVDAYQKGLSDGKQLSMEQRKKIYQQAKKDFEKMIDELDENCFVFCEVCDSVSALDEEIITTRVKEVIKSKLQIPTEKEK